GGGGGGWEGGGWGEGVEAIRSIGMHVRPDGRGCDRELAAWLEGGVRDAPDMPKLQHDAAARDMDCAGDALPTFDLLRAVDARRRDIALAFRRDLRRFGDDEPCTCALRVLERVERVRHVAGAGAAPRQGRHGAAVGAVQRPGLYRGGEVSRA